MKMLVFTILSLFINIFAHASIEVKVISGDETNGSMSNSIVIVGPKNVFLVDVQRSESNAKKVVDYIKSTGKNLETVFITHAHPDHFLGGAIIKEAFPKAKFIAISEVTQDIKQNGETIRSRISKLMVDSKTTDKIPNYVVVPEALSSTMISFDGQIINVLEVKHSESENAGVLHLPQEKILISGDILYQGVHLWMHDGRFDGWISAIEKLADINDIQTVYPGHGEMAGPAIFNQNLSYIKNFKNALLIAKDAPSLVEAMKKLYPHYKMERFLSYGANKLKAQP